MPSYQTDEATPRLPVNAVNSFGLSPIDRASIKQLIGHSLALVEREFILQTLKYHRGNRTSSANMLRISIRSLRDRLRDYRAQGESVPEPGSSLPASPAHVSAAEASCMPEGAFAGRIR